MKQCSFLLSMVALATTAFLAACSGGDGAPDPVSASDPFSEGRVALSVNLGPIGVLARSQQMTPTRVVLQFNSGTSVVRDTVSVTGSGTLLKNYSFPAQAETLMVKGFDQRDSLLYQGSNVFYVQPGKTTNVTVTLDARFSSLRTKFPIVDSLTRFTLNVDGRAWGDSSVPLRSRIGDTVRFDNDYLAASPAGTLHSFSLRAYGRTNGADSVLYAADTAISIVSGSKQGFVVYLKWVGPGIGGKVALAVVLGPVPQVEILAKYADPFQSGGDTLKPPPASNEFGIPWNSAITYGTLYDARDGKTYRTVKIGKQTWMAENLNYRNTTGVDDTVGVCYKNSVDSCAKYGRRYLWNQVMAINAAYNNGSSRKCVGGFRAPATL
ncbi:MAG TPA: FISUMP domain-containing protein [Fibrobacteria bacterium]|nr:FISUMP domain-containing protein [Fibrobacteria bacterium]